MIEELPTTFKERLTKAFDASPFRSHRALSQAAGLGESRVHRILAGQFDDSKDGPGFFNVVRLAEQLSVTPDFFAGIRSWGVTKNEVEETALAFLERFEGSGNPTTKEFARRYVRGGNRLEAFEDLRPYFDLYAPPDRKANKIQVLHVGHKSLAGQRIGGSNPALLQTCFEEASPELQRKLCEGQVRAFDEGYICQPESINEMYGAIPMKINIDFLRSSMHVTDASGAHFLLLFAELIAP